jgi:lipocalin
MDLSRYPGRWYEIARYGSSFERDRVTASAAGQLQAG